MKDEKKGEEDKENNEIIYRKVGGVVTKIAGEKEEMENISILCLPNRIKHTNILHFNVNCSSS